MDRKHQRKENPLCEGRSMFRTLICFEVRNILPVTPEYVSKDSLLALCVFSIAQPNATVLLNAADFATHESGVITEHLF